jgi:hypothetical protein
VNQIRNNTMQGAVVGVVGSGGERPTNWLSNLRGLNEEILSISTINGVDIIDIRFTGTASATALVEIRNESNTQIVASNGQAWTYSSYFQVLNSPSAPNSYGIGMLEMTDVGAFVVQSNNALTDINQFSRRLFARTLSGGATVGRVRGEFVFGVTNGNSYDFTIRIGLPQMELGSVATSVIKTTGSVQPRNADVISKTGLGSVLVNGQGTILLDFIPLSLPDTTYQRLLGIDDGTSLTNGYDIGYGGGGFGNVARTTFRIGATPIFDSAQGAITIGQRQKVAFAFANNDFQVALNGSLQAASLSGSTNIQHSRVILGGRSDGTGNNIIHSFAYFPTRLPNATLQTLTTL